MNSLNTYRNKDGYVIKATRKAYNLFYKKQGFVPVTEQNADESKALPKREPTVAELKAQLTAAGIEFPDKAKRSDLVKLLEGADSEAEEPTDEESEEGNADE